MQNLKVNEVPKLGNNLSFGGLKISRIIYQMIVLSLPLK